MHRTNQSSVLLCPLARWVASALLKDNVRVEAVIWLYVSCKKYKLNKVSTRLSQFSMTLTEPHQNLVLANGFMVQNSLVRLVVFSIMTYFQRFQGTNTSSAPRRKPLKTRSQSTSY